VHSDLSQSAEKRKIKGSEAIFYEVDLEFRKTVVGQAKHSFSRLKTLAKYFEDF